MVDRWGGGQARAKEAQGRRGLTFSTLAFGVLACQCCDADHQPSAAIHPLSVFAAFPTGLTPSPQTGSAHLACASNASSAALCSLLLFSVLLNSDSDAKPLDAINLDNLLSFLLVTVALWVRYHHQQISLDNPLVYERTSMKHKRLSMPPICSWSLSSYSL